MTLTRAAMFLAFLLIPTVETLAATQRDLTVEKLTSFLGVSIEDEEFLKFVQEHHLKKSQKFDSGSFAPEGMGCSLLFRENRIVSLVLIVERPKKSSLKAYAGKLPSGITVGDNLEKVIERCGKPDYTSVSAKNKDDAVAGFDKRRLIVSFEKGRVSEIWISQKEFTLKYPEEPKENEAKDPK